MGKKSHKRKKPSIISEPAIPQDTADSVTESEINQDGNKSISVQESINDSKLSPDSGSSTSEIIIEEEKEITTTYIDPSNRWEFQFEAVAGTRHINAIPALPCQDAANSSIHPKPFVVVADGASSSLMSDIGAQTVVTAISRLLGTLEQEVIGLLDQDHQTEENGRRFALMLVKHARGVLIDLAQTQRRAVKDFRCTLLLAIVGTTNLLWLKVGDGAIVQEKIRILSDGTQESELRTIGEVGKGDFANETTFVDEALRIEDVKSGLCPAYYISGLAAMSDGAALALVSHDGTKVATRLSTWLRELRTGKLKKNILTTSFYDPEFSRRAMGDDCSVAMVANTLT